MRARIRAYARSAKVSDFGIHRIHRIAGGSEGIAPSDLEVENALETTGYARHREYLESRIE